MVDRKGSLMRWQGACGHGFVVYSLEPTPELCPDCLDKSRDVLADIVGEIDSAVGDLDCSGCPGTEELDEWLDESGVDGPMRDDIHKLAVMIDDARAALSHAEFTGRKMLDQYPKAERLELPED